MGNKEIFKAIYENRDWGDGSILRPFSGSGSNPDNAQPYVNFVRNFIFQKSITSVLDFGHGDWEMWRDYQFEDVSYLGVDVAEGLSESVSSKFGNSSRIFKFHDLNEEDLPNAELMISKDVLQHLTNKDIRKFLSECNKFRFTIICNDFYTRESIFFELKEFLQIRKRISCIKRKKNPFFLNLRINNSEIKSGQFRGIDLEKCPFRVELANLKIQIVLEYDGPKRSGIRKRVYLLSKQD